MDDVRYVAFCDILGFSNRILSDFNATQKAYQEFASLMSNPVVEEVTTTMYSDAILMTGESLGKILSAVQSVWFFALAQNLMICGAITQGRYWSSGMVITCLLSAMRLCGLSNWSGRLAFLRWSLQTMVVWNPGRTRHRRAGQVG
jgi:hypothetical protein